MCGKWRTPDTYLTHLHTIYTYPTHIASHSVLNSPPLFDKMDVIVHKCTRNLHFPGIYWNRHKCLEANRSRNAPAASAQPDIASHRMGCSTLEIPNLIYLSPWTLKFKFENHKIGKSKLSISETFPMFSEGKGLDRKSSDSRMSRFVNLNFSITNINKLHFLQNIPSWMRKTHAMRGSCFHLFLSKV